MAQLDTLPDDVIEIIIRKLSMNEKDNIREVNSQLKKLVRHMEIKIDKFDNLYKNILIPFSIFNERIGYIQLGIIIEWQSRFFCINCLNNGKCNCKNINVNKYNIIRNYIKDYIYVNQKYGKSSDSWFFESIVDWVLLETDGIRKLRSN